MAIDAETRRRMGEQAVRLARKVGYYSAGTVEFLVDAKRNFYFLEMNTRLQVEHPITEYVTGLDLVEQMIAVASGKPLSFRQEDVQLRGWAIEARIYAEDPKLYLPCIGRLERYCEPSESINGAPKGTVRCDSGILEGSEISIYYDPMICKLSTYGSNRAEALKRMGDALDAYVIKGVTHNIPLIREVIRSEKFCHGQISTNFLAETFPRGFEGHELSASEQQTLVAFAAQAHRIIQLKAFSGRPAAGLDVFHVRIGRDQEEKAFTRVQFQKDGRIIIGEGAGEEVRVATEWKGSGELFSATLNDTPVTMQILKRNALGFDIQHVGTVYPVTVLTESEHQLLQYMPKRLVQEASSNAVRAPMPGQIVSVSVKAGDVVKMGSDLLVIEAMKMQNVLKAIRAGTVKSVSVQAGKSVATDEVLVEFE
jgi:propionyl-CoA carboxylase alpha chain